MVIQDKRISEGVVCIKIPFEIEGYAKEAEFIAQLAIDLSKTCKEFGVPQGEMEIIEK